MLRYLPSACDRNVEELLAKYDVEVDHVSLPVGERSLIKGAVCAPIRNFRLAYVNETGNPAPDHRSLLPAAGSP
jgi:hypothetical protein